MPDNVNPLASLNPAELAALAKAQAAGVNVVGKDGQTTDITSQTPPAAEAAAAAAAAAKAAATASGDVDPANASAKATRPENVPEKFWDAEKGTVNTEALLKSYTELERARSKPATETPPATDKPAAMGEKPATEKPATETPPPVDQTVERTNAINAANAELGKDGKLSEATYASLEKVGYTKDVVDGYLAGQKAQAQLAMQAIHNTAGGKEAYDSMVKWGSANYSIEEQQAFNKAIHSGDAGMAKLAVDGLKSRYAAEFGKTASVRIETNGGVPSGNAFKSQQELTKAMNDPRYKSNDAAFHREVQERIQASQRQGIDIGIRIHR